VKSGPYRAMKERIKGREPQGGGGEVGEQPPLMARAVRFDAMAAEGEGEGSGAVVVEGPTPFTAEWWRRTGAGRSGCGGGGRRRRDRWKGRGSWRWKTSPTGGPHLSARGRERERGEEAGRWWAESGDGPRGEMVGWVCFFSNPFQIFFKPF
jgi:hypothetical protein